MNCSKSNIVSLPNTTETGMQWVLFKVGMNNRNCTGSDVTSSKESAEVENDHRDLDNILEEGEEDEDKGEEDEETAENEDEIDELDLANFDFENEERDLEINDLDLEEEKERREISPIKEGVHLETKEDNNGLTNIRRDEYPICDTVSQSMPGNYYYTNFLNPNLTIYRPEAFPSS